MIDEKNGKSNLTRANMQKKNDIKRENVKVIYTKYSKY